MSRVQEIVNSVKNFRSVYFSYFYNNPELNYLRVVIQVYSDVESSDFDGIYDNYDHLLYDLEHYYYQLWKAEKKLIRDERVHKVVFYLHFAWHILEALALFSGISFIFYMLKSSGVWEEIMGLF